MKYYMFPKRMGGRETLGIVKNCLRIGTGQSRMGGRYTVPGWVTCIATLQAGTSVVNSKDRIVMKYGDFLRKYCDEIIQRRSKTSSEKHEELIAFASLQQETEDSNNFMVINTAGQVWELPDFLRFVKEFNEVQKQRTIIYLKD